MHSPDQPSELPTGPVTFLFTEIEGSTRLLDELGDDYAGLLVTRAGHLWATVESMEQRRGMRILPFERERYERVLAGICPTLTFAPPRSRDERLPRKMPCTRPLPGVTALQRLLRR